MWKALNTVNCPCSVSVSGDDEGDVIDDDDDGR